MSAPAPAPASAPEKHIDVVYAQESKTQQEIDVGASSEYAPAACKEVSVLGSKTILVGRTSTGVLFATGPKCTHYGAALKNGVLSGDRISCPWHAACFNVHTGDIEDGPVLDALTTFKVREDADRVLLTVPVDAAAVVERRVPACLAGAPSTEHFLVLGGGAASLAAIETLRQHGFQGDITLVCAEPHLPYDRIKLSKAFPTPPVAGLLLRQSDFYATHRVKVLAGVRAESVDTAAKVVQTSAGPLTYSKLLCATGGTARQFKAPEPTVIEGADLGNVFTIRKYEDGHQFNALMSSLDATTSSLVILGAGFIGSEIANAFAAKWTNITVIEYEAVPFVRVLGAEVGVVLQRLLEAKGVRFLLSARTRALLGQGGVVQRVLVDVGGKEEELPANAVVIGAGIVLNTSYLRDAAGVSLGSDGSVMVDEHMQAAEDVFAAGDIARFPLWMLPEHGPVRIEHWDVALDTGRTAARNMLGQRAPYRVVPFFWSAQPVSVRYAGHCPKADEIIVSGNVADKKIIAFYVMAGVVKAVLAINYDPAAVAAHAAFTAGTMPAPDAIRAAVDPLAVLVEAAKNVVLE